MATPKLAQPVLPVPSLFAAEAFSGRLPNFLVTCPANTTEIILILAFASILTYGIHVSFHILTATTHYPYSFILNFRPCSQACRLCR